jgi:hypothetical protein
MSGYKPDESLERLRRQVQAESSDGAKLLKSLRNNPICSVEVDATIPCIVVAWKRYATSAQLRFVHESLLRLLQKHRIGKILGDDSALPTIHVDDQAWIVESWMPRAQAAGLRAVAAKHSESYFGKLALERIRSASLSSLPIRPFDDIEDARSWLRSLD